MADLIDRQAAIDALFELYEYQRDIDPTEAADLVQQGIFLAEKKIEKLPSAQPKAIRPKFVAEDRYLEDYFQMFPHCPKCNSELETGDCYCRVCGCHIDWGEDDE